MIEYAVNLKIGSTPDLVLMSTITSDLNTAKEHLERTNREIRAENIRCIRPQSSSCAKLLLGVILLSDQTSKTLI